MRYPLSQRSRIGLRRLRRSAAQSALFSERARVPTRTDAR